MVKKIIFILSLILFSPRIAAAFPIAFPKISLGLDTAKTPQDFALTLQIILLITILSLAPSIVIAMTSFVRILIVLSFAKHALAIQQAPPNHIIAALALFLTTFIMAPTITKVYNSAAKPLIEGKLPPQEAAKQAIKPVREFMFKYTREKDIDLFLSLGKFERPKNRNDVPTYVLIPAFMVSELTCAFKMGVLLFLPFLVIDMIVASILMGMGMIMLPPAMISLPFKVLLFVLVDGWHLLIYSLLRSFN